jgi:hypothetical protein
VIKKRQRLWRALWRGTMCKSSTCLLPCRTWLPVFYMKYLKEQCMKRQLRPLRTTSGIRTQHIGESLQESVTTVEQLTHRAFPALHENHVCRGTGKGIHWWHTKTKHKTPVTSGKWENCQCGHQADPIAGSHKAGSLVVHQAAKNEWQGIVEGPTPSKSSVPTNEKRNGNMSMGYSGPFSFFWESTVENQLWDGSEPATTYAEVIPGSRYPAVMQWLLKTVTDWGALVFVGMDTFTIAL